MVLVNDVHSHNILDSLLGRGNTQRITKLLSEPEPEPESETGRLERRERGEEERLLAVKA